MSLSPQLIAERRRLSRRLLLWRTAAALAAAIAVVAWVRAAGVGSPWGSGGDGVAVIDISGVIVQDDARERALKNAADDDSIKALVVRIDSPGGTFVGSDALYRSLRAVTAEKPVVALIGNVAASGGYMAAIAADHIFASRGSITGSIGVIFQSPRVNRLLDNVGVDVDVWRSGELKARPSPLEPPNAAVDAQAEDMVRRLFGIFIDIVRERRSLSTESERRVSDGRVVIGAHALDLGLIDAIGDMADARSWLEENGAVPAGLREVDITPPPPYERKGLMAQALAFVLGNEQTDAILTPSGLLALWRPLSSVR